MSWRWTKVRTHGKISVCEPTWHCDTLLEFFPHDSCNMLACIHNKYAWINFYLINRLIEILLIILQLRVHLFNRWHKFLKKSILIIHNIIFVFPKKIYICDKSTVKVKGKHVRHLTGICRRKCFLFKLRRNVNDRYLSLLSSPECIEIVADVFSYAWLIFNN